MTYRQTKTPLDLSAAQRQVLHSMAGGEAPHAQRAQALLALAGGQELESAAAASGLTANQARYWQGRFNSQGLAAFPDDLVAQHTAAPALPQRDHPGLLSAPPPSLQLAGGPSPADALPAGAAVAGTLEASKKEGKKTKTKKDSKGKSDKEGKKGKKKKKGKKGKDTKSKVKKKSKKKSGDSKRKKKKKK